LQRRSRASRFALRKLPSLPPEHLGELALN
jgi:hypothetical protein